MRLTKHEEYGLRCLLRLAEQGEGKSLTIPETSRAEGISEAYTGKLLRMLRRADLVKAERGKIGGYTLGRPSSQIVIGDVIAVLGSPLFKEDFCNAHSGRTKTCVRSTDCSLRALWRTVQVAVDQILSRTTLADLLNNEQQVMIRAQGLMDSSRLAEDAIRN